MDHCHLGHSGLKVSRLCLGTMMFGRWGNADVDDEALTVQLPEAHLRRIDELVAAGTRG